MISESEQNRFVLNFAWRAIALAVLVGLAFGLYQDFMTPDNMRAPTFGTAWAPYSDALGPWLDGALSFLFGYPPPNYLYRPTVGLFWGSILAAGGRIEGIPGFFSLWLLSLVTFLTFHVHRCRIGRAFILTLALLASTFTSTWHYLNIATTAVDFPALVITLSGILLVLIGVQDKHHLALLVGSLCLGVAGGIRGPMMIAGPVFFGIAMFAAGRVPVRIMVASLMIFLLPIVIDITLQRHYVVENNGLIALYCAYADPSHAWTPDCHTDFLARMPSGGVIIARFLADLFSIEGIFRLVSLVNARINEDVQVLQGPASLAFLVICCLQLSRSLGAVSNTIVGFHKTPHFRALLVTLSLLAVTKFTPHLSWIPLVWLCVMLGYALVLRQWYSLASLAGYLAATTYLCLLGLHAPRLQNTFAFLLPLGLSFLVLFIPSYSTVIEAQVTPPRRNYLPIIIAAMVGFLYLSVFNAPSSLRDNYTNVVKGRAGVAIKIGADGRIDRSLYYTGDRQLIYTKNDSLKIGAIRHYERLLTTSIGNESFRKPNRFMDIPE